MNLTLTSLMTALALLLTTTQSAQAANFSCTSDTKLKLQVHGLQANPGTVASLSLMDSQQVRDILITNVEDSGDSVYVEFADFTTPSAFSFELGKESIESASITLTIFELGSPGQFERSHEFTCQKN